MRDIEIGMEFMLYREDDGVVLGYVRTPAAAREISLSSGVTEAELDKEE